MVHVALHLKSHHLLIVGVDNPWGNINVNDIPMELVSDPIASDNEVIISTDK